MPVLSTIWIWETDDALVAGVQVLVLDEEGKIVEKGDATQGRCDWWEYVPSADKVPERHLHLICFKPANRVLAAGQGDC